MGGSEMRKKMGESILQTAKKVESKELNYKEMKTGLKPTDPEYIEALALQEYPCLDSIDIDKVTARINKRNGYIQGAKDILSHTNHADLVEAIKKCKSLKIFEGWGAEESKAIEELMQVLTKSETSKL